MYSFIQTALKCLFARRTYWITVIHVYLIHYCQLGVQKSLGAINTVNRNIIIIIFVMGWLHLFFVSCRFIFACLLVSQSIGLLNFGCKYLKLLMLLFLIRLVGQSQVKLKISVYFLSLILNLLFKFKLLIVVICDLNIYHIVVLIQKRNSVSESFIRLIWTLHLCIDLTIQNQYGLIWIIYLTPHASSLTTTPTLPLQAPNCRFFLQGFLIDLDKFPNLAASLPRFMMPLKHKWRDLLKGLMTVCWRYFYYEFFTGLIYLGPPATINSQL